MHARWMQPVALIVLTIASIIAIDTARAPVALAQDVRRERRGEGTPPPPDNGDPRSRPPADNRDPRGTPPENEPRIAPPNERPGAGRWYLGATVEPQDIGVRVREVAPRSAAERAGLERDDTIITVNGFQVGRVDGREFPLEVELQNQADASGRVRLLVQDRRNERLTNMDVNLDRDQQPPAGGRDGVVSGEFAFRDPISLPPNAELRLRVIQRKMIGSSVIAERTDALHGRPPTSYEIRYPVNNVDRDTEYEIQAEIFGGGRHLFTEDGRYKFRASDPPSRLQITLKQR